jgi:GntR family transcriptional regulator
VSVDPQSPVPLYRQLMALLTSRITGGLLKPGDVLPSERQLCEEFGLSRTTVREALRALNRQGLIRTVPGRGAFVATPRPDLTVKVSLTGFTGDVRREGMTPSSRLLDAGLIISPAPALIELLGLQAGDEVVKLERLRLINNVPLALHTVFLNHRLCPQILQHNLAEESLFQLLRSEYGLKLTQAKEQVYAALADQREMGLLDLSYPAAVLRTERKTFLDTGAVIEFSRATYCGEWYRLSMVLEATE